MGARAQPPWALDLLERVPGSRPHWTRGSVSMGIRSPDHRGTLHLLERNTWSCPVGTSCPVLPWFLVSPRGVCVVPRIMSRTSPGSPVPFHEQTPSGIRVSRWIWGPGNTEGGTFHDMGIGRVWVRLGWARLLSW